MIIADSSPLIVFGRIDRFDVLYALLGTITIPTAVYQETVVNAATEQQRAPIRTAITAGMITVLSSTTALSFKRKLGVGEQGVLLLASEHRAHAIIIDDKKARNEATELGFTLFYTTDILRAAAQRGLIPAYAGIIAQLRLLNIYLPG